jgi:transcriptional regulator MraZ
VSSGFSGQYDHAIDEKGRVSIPMRFREVLERDGNASLFITKHSLMKLKCLALYPPAEWQRLLGTFSQKSSFRSDVKLFTTYMLGNTHEAEVDKQGRILVPPNLREFAGLRRDVTFLGSLDHLVLWERSMHDRFQRLAESKVTSEKFLEGLER